MWLHFPLQLLELKRDTGPLGNGEASANNGSSAVLSLATGLCFDFCPSRPQIFVVGTEEGSIFKCSKDYSGQLLSSYKGTLPARRCPGAATSQPKAKAQRPCGTGGWPELIQNLLEVAGLQASLCAAQPHGIFLSDQGTTCQLILCNGVPSTSTFSFLPLPTGESCFGTIASIRVSSPSTMERCALRAAFSKKAVDHESI